MFFKNYHTLFLTALLSSTIISISSNSWFTAWLGLEINLMSMIPLMLIKLNFKATEAAIKYFLSQALASLILIFMVSMNFIGLENMNLEVNEILIVSSLILKAGIAPFHFWFPQVTSNLLWLQCLLIFTWQKIAPLILIISMTSKMILFSAFLSATTGAVGGFNQKFLKLILTYSSISHSGWMLMTCLTSINNWGLYFLIYSFLSLTLVLFFMTNHIKKINQIFTGSDSISNKMILSLNMLSLGGLPPLLGFSAKLSVILTSLKNLNLLIFLPLIIASLVSLFFYTRVIYTNMMNTNKTVNFYIFMEKKSLPLIFILSIFLNISSPLIFIFL